MIAIVGTSHAPEIFRQACTLKGLTLGAVEESTLVIVSEDTPTDADGFRELRSIRQLIDDTVKRMRADATLVITSQVPPGFTRALGMACYHQSETLRIKDALERALHPEQMIVGCAEPSKPLPAPYLSFLIAFNCPVWQVSYETAEFSKIAINMMLAAQVERTNELAGAAANVGADWQGVRTILQHDRRIGPHAYLTPGRWQDSAHLLRDYATLLELSK